MRVSEEEVRGALLVELAKMTERAVLAETALAQLMRERADSPGGERGDTPA